MIPQTARGKKGRRDMKNRSTRSVRSSMTESAERVLLVFCYLVTWALCRWWRLWPAGDPHPQTTAMILAAERGDLAAIDETLRGGLDVDSRDAVRRHAAHGRRPHRPDRRGTQAPRRRRQDRRLRRRIRNAADGRRRHGDHDVMRELVERGANVDAVNPTGQTALWYARMGGDEEAVRILIAGSACTEGRSARSGERG